jgi:hypothetical protein
VSDLAQMEEETAESQVGNLAEAIQQLQERVAELELQAVLSTLQEVRDQREKLSGEQSKESRYWPWNTRNSAIEVRRLMSALQRTQNYCQWSRR